MRHLHIKPNSGSKNNVGSVSGTKVTSVSQKTGGTKRILGEPERSTKKRKLSENPSKKKASAAGKQPEADKTQKKGHGATAKRPCANPKKVKKSDGKSKKVTSKSDKKTNAADKVLKRCKNSGKGEENEGPPTLCETFSRITTMVAETVINEKENQKLTESLMGKVKKEADFSKHKGESSGGDSVKHKKGSADAESFKSKSSGKKTTETSKKGKASTTAKPKMAKGKSEPKKSKTVSKKPKEKATLDNTENLVKVLKDEEMPLVFGKGIGTRRKSTAGFGEFETKPETSESTKSKNDVVPKAESSKKKVAAKKVVVKKEKPKPKVSESQLKKYSEEVKKSSEKGKEEPSNLKDSSHKKVIPKKESAKAQARVKKKAYRGSPAPKGTKTPLKEAKSPKPKLGSETDGSNSDELTLSILQKKTKKTKIESEKSDTSEKGTKGLSLEDVKPSPEERVADVEKNSSKFGKLKIKKEEKNEPTYKKILEMSKDKKKTKETESDTDEDMELRRIMAKKLRRVIKPEPEAKKKKAEPSKSVPESEQRARRLKLFGFWSGPKRHRVASLNAIAKVHCLYENESKGVLAEIEKLSQSAKSDVKKGEKKDEKMNKVEKKVLGSSSGKKSAKDSERLDIVGVNKRILRGNLGNRGAGKHWDMFTGDSTTSLSSPSASSDEGHSDTEKSKEKKLPLQPSYRQKLLKKEDEEKEDIVKAPKRRRNNELEVTMDLKDMVVRKRMASLNASAILAASYSTEKRSNRKDSSGTSTEDGMSSNEDNDRFLSDEGENTSSKAETKKPTNEQEKAVEVKNKEEDGMNAPECTEYRHKKHFWKTKVESLKKSSREKRNSPSPILAEFGVKKDLSTTILEKEKNDKMNVDKEKDKSVKLSYPRKYLEGRMKGKVLEGKIKNVGKAGGKEPVSEKDYRRKYSKRKLCDEDVKNINIEKVRGVEKSDEYEYKSDSDNGQRKLIELRNTGGSNKKVAVIVNQDTDVTITGVYVNSTRSTHHEGFCSIAGMQYRISSTSHTQTEATAVLKTSTASEQTPSPSEPRNCTSPRGHKSYTPLSALSNMQPPAGAPPHPHLPPPPHHHHHLCGMGQHRPPPDHYIGHGPISHQRPMSPLGRRHGCSSAFTAPHCSSHPAPGDPMSGASDGEGFGPPLPPHGYFQPAGPLIHHHSSSSAPPIKSQNSTTSDTSSATESQAPASANEEPAETAGRSAPETSAPAPPPPPAAHHMGYPRGYPPYQGGYYQGTYYPPPPQSAHFQPPPPSFHQHYHHHQDLCYPPGYPPASYPPHPGSYRRFLQPPPGYYSPELTYGGSGPPSSQDHGAQQMVVPGGASSSYSAPLDSYPPPTPYYPGYSPGPGPACYSHPPSSRNLAFIEQTYQSCPCPMQLCPKNVHIGPLTGECKRPGALPLPPVALQLPQEPPGAAGPPSPARGSAGMPPQPSPAASNSARPNWDAGRTSTKSAAETKWEESKTVLELKPLKSNYKSEKLSGTEAKDLQNLSNVCNLMKKCAESADNKWIDLSYSKRDKEKETFSQGLLAISSKEMLLLTTKGPELPSSIITGEDEKKIKTETVIPSGDEVEVLKKREMTSRKRNSRDDSPKRKKLIAKLEEILVNNLEENKNRKRMAETVREDYENKVRKIQKVATVDQKDENVCIDGRHVKKQHKHTNTKAKLLKDRNESINRTEGFHQNGIKSSGKKEKVEELNGKVEADKIVNRRKSNQDKSDFFPEAEIRSVRKSKSCSPSRSKTRENSPVTQTKEGEETKKKFENGRATAKPKVKLQDHSRITGKRKNCSGGSKSGKQVAVLPKGVNKSKKSRSEYSMSVTSLKKLASKKGHSASPRTGLAPKWSNGWSWDSESFDAKVYLTNDEPPVIRKCYTAMRHVEGDVIHPKDCILLKAGPRRIDLPFVAKVAALWENPDDGEMMVSLLWYYRPEHTDQGRQPSDQQDEIFASRHKDINSVACIEDKCFVLTYNEYCRYRKKVKRVEEGVAEKNLPVPRLEQPYFRFQRQPPCVMAPDMVFFCRRVYDFRQKRLLKNPT